MKNIVMLASSELSKGNTFSVLGETAVRNGSDVYNVEIIAWNCDSKDKIVKLIDVVYDEIRKMEKQGISLKIGNLDEYYELIHGSCERSMTQNLKESIHSYIRCSYGQEYTRLLTDDRMMYLQR